MNNKQLITDHKKLIEFEAGKYSTMVPHEVVLAEAYRLAHKAAEGFDNTKGAKFSTHLTNQLKKLSRISTQYGTSVRLPENKQYKLNMLNRLKAELEEELGRPPSTLELSERSHLPLATVNHILQHRAGEVNSSKLAYTPVFVDNQNDEWMHFVYHDLSDIDRLIFEHKTGFGGKKQMNNEELAKMLKLSPSTVAQRANHIAERINENWLDE